MNSKVFVSGALTGIADAETVKSNYEHIGRLCEQLGLEAYIPHLHTDPIANPDVPSREVYEVDRYHVRTAGLVIAYVRPPLARCGARDRDRPAIWRPRSPGLRARTSSLAYDPRKPRGGGRNSI